MKPENFEALVARGNSLFSMKSYAEAVTRFEEALKIKPDAAEVHNNLGGALGMLGRHAEALASFEKAIELSPGYLDALTNRANALRALGRHNEAFNALMAGANALVTAKRYREAVRDFNQALRIKPDSAEAHHHRGAALGALNRHSEALKGFERAIELKPDYVEAYKNHGTALQALGRHDEAIASYDKALAIKPQDPATLRSRAVALRALKHNEEALSCIDRALVNCPGLAELHLERARTLMDLGRLDEALESHDKALAIESDSVVALVSRGFLLRQLGRLDDALICYRRALLFQPDNWAARGNLALTLLAKGDIHSGLTEYEWRWKKPGRPDRLRHFPQPRWVGQVPVAGKTLFLYHEQGFGDTLQMVRYVPLLVKQGAKVILQVQAPLVPLLREQLRPAVVIGPREPLPSFELHSPLMSTLLALGTNLETIPAQVPYLTAPRDRIPEWTNRIGPKRFPRVGIAWSGSSKHVNDHNRSIPLKELLPLLTGAFEVVSLQKDVRETDNNVLKAEPRIRDFRSELKDFADTAALISHVDMVISVDTAVAHVAGAMAKTVWILLPFRSDWRWLVDREDSPWYPTARLFRQPRFGDWHSVIRRIVEELRQRFASSAADHSRIAS